MDPTHATPPPTGSFLTPLLISLAGVAASSLAIVAYHMVLVKYCLRRRQRRDRNVWIPPDRAVAKGVEKKILEAIPILSFSREKVREFRTNQTECVVCLGELEEGDTVRLLPNCRHVFHVPCIDNWFQARSSCPVCRTRVSVTTGSNPTSPAPDDENGGERIQDLPQSQEQDRDQATSTAGFGSKPSLRHCVSLVFPRETKQKRLITGLKRSLSMDQFYVLIKLAEENEKASSSSFTSISKRSLTMSDSSKAQSMRQLDQMSSMLRSLSQLRVGRSSNPDGILPY